MEDTILYCTLCNIELVSEDHQYVCNSCEEVFCQACFMDVPKGLDKDELSSEDDDDGEQHQCVYCKYGLEFGQTSIQKIDPPAIQ